MTCHLVGLTAHAFAGKDTVADFITQYSGGRWEKVTLAFPLKRAVEAMFSLPSGACDDREARATRLPASGVTVARSLQLVGQSMRNLFGKDFWVRLLMRRTELSSTDPSRQVIVTDVRYWNEAEAITLSGGIIVKIERASQLSPPEGQTTPPTLQQIDGRDGQHPSETEVDAIHPDVILDNNGSLDDLSDQVRQLMEVLSTRTITEWTVAKARGPLRFDRSK